MVELFENQEWTETILNISLQTNRSHTKELVVILLHGKNKPFIQKKIKRFVGEKRISSSGYINYISCQSPAWDWSWWHPASNNETATIRVWKAFWWTLDNPTYYGKLIPKDWPKQVSWLETADDRVWATWEWNCYAEIFYDFKLNPLYTGLHNANCQNYKKIIITMIKTQVVREKEKEIIPLGQKKLRFLFL